MPVKTFLRLIDVPNLDFLFVHLVFHRSCGFRVVREFLTFVTPTSTAGNDHFRIQSLD